ncbi:hypothetical protein FRX31_009384 [Thalictrum thalictroides]|uniref:O-acyltransferase WSD1 C-terminal domain-containing protein n=1 Tax=Thalictrum thalictroides TaxID=46969 RepID=A0A7J6WVT7_THATH|nr:hypothetical protein FRX31_009384 [Thalictrum thalictroides]
MITNLIGPNEKMAMAGHPVGSCYFIVAGLPQSLTFTTASWMGQLRITATLEKNFIDSQLFNSCMKDAFENIFQAACEAVHVYDHLHYFCACRVLLSLQHLGDVDGTIEDNSNNGKEFY